MRDTIKNIVYEEFSRLDNTKIIMHNGKFDYQVIKCTTGKQLKVYWDTMIGARILKLSVINVSTGDNLSSTFTNNSLPFVINGSNVEAISAIFRFKLACASFPSITSPFTSL